MTFCSRLQRAIAPYAMAFSVVCPLIWVIPRLIVAQDGLLPTPSTAEEIRPEDRLQRIPIFLEVSDNLFESIPIPSPRTRWSFPEDQAESAKSLFLRAGLNPAAVESLTSRTATIRADGWIHFFPDHKLVEEMSRESRAMLYGELGHYPINEFQESPALILTDTVEEWYRSSHLRPESVAEISRMAYRRGDLWAFSDVPLLISKCQGERDLKALYKTLTRTRTYLITIPIGTKTDAAAVKAYWRPTGSGFRRKDIEPLIESIKGTDREVQLDLAHIMPPLARKLIYTYPGTENISGGILPDCHWTSLNYFNYEPQGYLLDSSLATSKVIEDYEKVTEPWRYGDILFFIDDVSGDAYHSCVFLKEDLVFSKNGRNQMTPWIISTIQDISRIYLSTREGHIETYRLRAHR
jgi:hypothetical protein